MVSEEEGKFLVKLAKESIKNYIVRRKIMDVPEDVPDTLKEDMGAFVTLNKNGMLRGCIGYSEPVKPLVNAVIDVAISAAVNDPRFPPVSLDEIDDL
ncbi:MAG: AmmeMemoRadiSam system protein A, partial [Methanobacterium sp.]